jgi:glutathione S-transferase
MKLYTSSISHNGKRVRITAAELGIPLEETILNPQKSENRTPEYLKLNPMGKVPTLTDGDFALTESAAILSYLATTKESPLLPREPRAQAEVLRWMFFTSCHLDPFIFIFIVERFFKARRSLPPDEKLTGYAEEQLKRFVPIIEDRLTGREFLTDHFSIADIATGCTLELAPVLRFDLAAFPAVRSWLERLQSRESWRAATAQQVR